jgi:hypothetical protein
MKGKISLVEFIKEVKAELRSAVDNESPFFEMGEVELEVTFALDVGGKAGLKLVVAEFGGETKATQTHKVKIKLHPFVEDESDQEAGAVSQALVKPATQKGAIANAQTVLGRLDRSAPAKGTIRPKASKGVSMPRLAKKSPTASKKQSVKGRK